MENYNKLVRDKIPEIIESNGAKPITRILDDSEYKIYLEKKLVEETNEVLESKNEDRLEELADLLEVIKALVVIEGSNIEEVNNIAIAKSIKKGAFNKKILLEKVEKLK